MVDFPDTLQTPAFIVAGNGYRAGVIDTPKDADWYRVDLKKDTAYALVSKGHGLYLELRGKKGELLQYIVTGPTDADGFGFSVPTSGRYVVGVRNFLQDTGPYQIKVANEAGDNAVLFATAKPGVTAGGYVSFPHDRDWFQISLQKGKSYAFTYTSPERIEFSMRDSLGRIYEYDPDATSTPFLAPYTGKYFLEASSVTDKADFSYSFTFK